MTSVRIRVELRAVPARARPVRWSSAAAILAATTLALCAAATSRAAPVQPVRLVWARAEGAESCSSAPDVRQQVSQRLGADPFADDAPRTVEAVVERVHDRWVARIQVRDRLGQTRGTRKLTSDSADCEPLQSAAVLAIALVIDPNARILPVASASSPPVASSSSAPPASSSAPPPPPPPLPVISAVPPLRPAPVTQITASRPVESPGMQSAALTLRGGVTAGLVPGASPAAGLTGNMPVAPSWNVVAHSLFVAESRAADARFVFGLSAFGLGACYQLSGALTVGACASGWLGSTWAVVQSIPPTHPGGRAFTALSVDPYARVGLVGPLHLELAGDLFVPVVRRAFTVTGWPDPVWRQPPVAAAVFLGVGLHFR